jgi:dihydrofolate reductase
MSEPTYTVFEIGGGDIVTQCCDCGAHVLNKSKSDVKHCKTCVPGEAERWKEHYSQPDPTTDEEDEQICKAMEAF